MRKNESYIRYPKPYSEKKISDRFGLYWDKSMQDWELTVSDSGRIRDFLKVYQTELDNDDDKFTLMGLIISSFEDGMTNFDEQTKNHWNVCKVVLEKECYLHFSLICYWSMLEVDTDDVFKITPYMREVWEKVKLNFA